MVLPHHARCLAAEVAAVSCAGEELRNSRNDDGPANGPCTWQATLRHNTGRVRLLMLCNTDSAENSTNSSMYKQRGDLLQASVPVVHEVSRPSSCLPSGRGPRGI